MLAQRIPRLSFSMWKLGVSVLSAAAAPEYVIQCRNGANLSQKMYGEQSFRAFKLPFSSVIDLNASMPSPLPAWGSQHFPLMLMETYCMPPLPGMTSVQARRHSGGRTSPDESASLPLRDIFQA